MSALGLSAAILEKVITSDEEVPIEIARHYRGLSLSRSDLDRIQILSGKANEGQLTSDEGEELRLYAIISDFLTIMELRADDAPASRSLA